MPNLIGSAANQVSTNGMLGTAAFMEPQTIVKNGFVGLTSLAVITPTVSANIDVLTGFSSAYSNYLIIGEGIRFTTDEGISFRLANAGVVDTASNYHNTPISGGTSSATSTITVTTGTIRTAGTGCTFEISILNANEATQPKLVQGQAAWMSTVAGPVFNSLPILSTYNGGICTGFRLYSSLGGNFAAQGKIRVFGYNNI